MAQSEGSPTANGRQENTGKTKAKREGRHKMWSKNGGNVLAKHIRYTGISVGNGENPPAGGDGGRGPIEGLSL